VLSALKHDDPLNGMVEHAIEEFQKEWGDLLNVEFVNVSSESDLVAALNAYEGPMGSLMGTEGTPRKMRESLV
jgi:hypothetical protein